MGVEIGVGKGICNQGSVSGTLPNMKLLLALAIGTQIFLPAPVWAKQAPVKDEAKEHEAAVAKAKAAEVVTDDPNKPRERKPGFWERAWVSAGKTWQSTKKVAHTVTHPFHHGDSTEELAGPGWRKLSMTLEKSVAVSVTVTNPSKSAVQLQFPNSQRIEVLVKDEASKVLSKWSEDQKVSDDEGFLVINPGEKLDYTATVSTRDMVPGKTYVIEAFFPTFDELRASRTVVPTK
jgi:hypothetical protein